MSTPAPTLSKPASLRRVRYTVQALTLLFAATAVCAFIVILGDRFPKRFDATATREHQLSPRTRDLLDSLTGDYELVVAANFSTLDQTAASRTQDVLDNFGRASPHVRATIIDVSSARGLTDLDALLARLVDRFKPELEKQRKGIASATATAAPLSDTFNALSDNLLATRDTVKDGDPSADALRRFFTDAASVCRIAGENILKSQALAKESASKTLGRTTVPATDDAVAILARPLSDAMGQLSQIGDNINAVVNGAADRVSAATRERAKPTSDEATKLRRDLGESLAALEGLPRTPLASVLRVLEKTSAAIVIAPPPPPAAPGAPTRPSVTSIELSAIYPPRTEDGTVAPQIDLRARTEDLLAGAITSLARADAPIVVFVHGRERRMAPAYTPVASIVERLRLRGVDFAEYAAGLDAEPPSLASIDPTGKRPVVHIVIAMNPSRQEDAARFGKLVQATEKLVQDGKSVLLCEVPSTLPGVGAKDPMAEILAPLGVQLDSGRPLMKQSSGPRGRLVSADLLFTDPGTDHPLAGAVRGLPLLMPWSLPVRISEHAAGVKAVVTLDNAGKSIWAESEYLGFLEQPSSSNLPTPESSRDDPAGPWPIVVSVERTVGGSAQRVLIVGSNRWMSGEIMGAETDVESRRVPTYPGNIELMDAGISWLAHQDSLISASPQSQQLPLIPPLTEPQIGALKWALIGGLPLVILLIGAIWRLARG